MAPSITMHLDGHCIETAAKIELRRRTDELLAAVSSDPSDADAITLLTDFLQSADFQKLRSSDERLSGTIPSTVALLRGNDGKVIIKILE